MKVLGDLQQLCVLRFRVKPPHDGNINFNVVVEGEEDHSYKNIKILEIASASNLHLTFGSRTMKNLELLTAGCCNNGSQLQFDGLNHLSKLKDVRVIGSKNENLRKKIGGPICWPWKQTRFEAGGSCSVD